MPAYIASPFKPPVQLMIPGTPSYVLGSYNDRTEPTRGYVISDSAVTTTGTLTFQIVGGNVPIVGALISVVGTTNGAGVFNVTNATILTVTSTDQGVCTVTFAISSTTQVTTADGGQVLVPQPEVGETVVTGASVPVAVSFTTANPDQGKVITVNIGFPTIPTTVTGVFLQAANFDRDQEYVDVSGAIASVAASTVTGGSWNTGQGTTGTIQAVNQLNYRFYRLRVAGVVGSGLIVGKLEI